MTHFERLGLPRRFSLDPAALEREYLARSRALHPDFHQQGGVADQAASVELSSRLNEAYATIKEPFRRADYLLQLAGAPSAADMKAMPAAFLEEMLETRMAIDDLAPGSPEAAAMEETLAAKLQAMLDDVGARLDGESPDLASARQALNAVKYVQNLLRDLRGA